MRENYFEEKFDEIKGEILDEMHKLIPEGSVHYFRETFYVHYIDGEVATTEICAAVEIDQNEMTIFHVRSIGDETTEMVAGFDVLKYEPCSFLDILDHLKKDVREKKLSHLRNILKKNGSQLHFDGSFTLSMDEREDSANECGIVSDCHLTGIELCNDDTLTLYNFYDGGHFENKETSILTEDLDKLIAYVESKTKRKFVVRVSGSFSRTFEIEDNNFEEALAEAKKDWEINPLCFDDSNGEDWEDYTSVAH